MVELERVRSELQALKRRIPVRARELDPAEIADMVAEILLSRMPAPPRAAVRPAAKRARRAAAPPPVDLDMDEDEDDDDDIAPVVAPAKPARRRQRPLRPE